MSGPRGGIRGENRGPTGIVRRASLLAALILVVCVSPASAAYRHGEITGEYGRGGPKSSGIGDGCSIAYQSATHRLYLFSNERIYGLDRTGAGIVSPLAGSFPIDTGVTSRCGDPALAVDNSSGASAGNLYVVPSTHLIYGFDSMGESLGSPWPVDAGGETCGVAVTGNGEVWGGDYGNEEVAKFTAAGAGSGSVLLDARACKLAVDKSNGDIYTVTYGQGRVVKHTAASGYTSSLTFPPVVLGSAGIALNSVKDRIYIPVGEQIEAYDTESGALLETFEVGGHAASVAVDEQTDIVFVTNSSTGVIEEFPGAMVPAVTTGANSHTDRSATFSGRVDPDGDGVVAACDFEYTDNAAFSATGYENAKSAPCRPGPPFSTPTNVSAPVSGLQPGVGYHYRLVASNANGESLGASEQFMTPRLPGVLTGRVTSVGQNTATVTGEVSIEGGLAVVECHFEYVDDTAFRAGGFDEVHKAPCEPSPPYDSAKEVSGELTNLDPGTIYHYRLVATNTEGMASAEAEALTTLASDQEEHEERTRHPKPHHVHGPVRCAKKACTLSLDASTRLRSWASPQFPRAYGWIIAIFKNGHSLPNTNVGGGCRGAFQGQNMIATVDGCRGRLKLTYLGSGRFTIRWRVFEHCACAKHTNESQMP